ncbi:MAG: SDR family oxidoreductase [Myxococcota bacterium]
MSVSAGRVLVTGASRGIGRATARKILERGGRVVAVGRDDAKLEEVRALAPDRVRVVVTDLGRTDALGKLADAAVAAFDGLDGLVNCAGVARYESVGAISRDAVDLQVRINWLAPLFLSQYVAENLQGRGGAIVNVSSTLSERAAATTAVYAATKAALNAITKTLALELAASRIRVNAVLPGVVDTEMVRAPRRGPGDPPLEGPDLDAEVQAQLDSLRALHPLGRLGQPDEIADVILGLLDHPWQTGSLVVVDGGLSVA